MIMRIVPAVLSALIAASALVAATAGQASATTAVFAHASGTFSTDAPAYTYNPALVPDGASAWVLAVSLPLAGTTTTLAVHGLLPNHEYGAHAHAKACGTTGDAAGPHFQYVPDPVTPSVDPAYANPRNEIWLDFTTDRFGNGHAVSQERWPLTDRHPNSVVIHEMHTHTDPGHAGTAGARLACLNVAF
jgi:Cu-Zn family superoxide dismutase